MGPGEMRTGHEAQGATSKSNKPMGWVKGTIGMVKKLQEKGGF